MTETIRDPSQSAPAATTLTALYTVPALTTAVVSSLTVCNWSATPTTYRIMIAPAGAADANAHRIAYDVAIAGNAHHDYTEGWTLGPGTIVRVYATLATLTFNLFKVERS